MVAAVASLGPSLVEAAVRGAVLANGSRQVVAAVTAAAVRTAMSVTDEVSDCDDVSLKSRKQVVSASLEAHAALNELALPLKPAHCLGLAAKAVHKQLPAHLRRAVKQLREMANSAKHEWASDSSAASTSVEEAKSPADVCKM